jgi:YD repeat-containing protein
MKKLLFGVLGLMICLVFACKKGEPLHKTYLLSQQIIDDRADGLPVDTTNFFYDNQNHLTLVTTNNGQRFSISYDAAGRVNIAKTINSNGAVTKQFNFFYAPIVGFFVSERGKKDDTAYFSFNGKQQVTEIRTLHTGYSTFTYDERGNVANLQKYGADGIIDLHDEAFYSYDNKKSYFSQVAPNNYYLMYILYSDASTLINNAITKNADSYTYTYNNEGFPVKAMAKVVGHALTPIYYNYIVK